MPVADVDEGVATRTLGEFVATLRYEDLPDEVIHHTRLCLLDTLGCALFGSTLPWSRIVAETASEVDGAGGVPVWGTGLRLSAPHAALVNGAATHAFELDDLHRESILHAGSVVVSASLAASTLTGAPLTGRDLLVALVSGYEIGARTGMTVGAAHLLQGWHPTGTHGTMASAAACAAVLGLDAAQAQQALGIAGSQASGLMAAQFESMVKRFHAGRAAQSGLYATLLARNGYTGIRRIFEESYGGYCSTMSTSHDLSGLTANLGERWEVERVIFKAFSTNGSCHPSIEILRRLRAENDLRLQDIDAVVIRCSSATHAHVGWKYVPDSVTTAQMNLPYITAVVLADGDAFVDQFSPERIVDLELVEFAGRVECVADPEIDAGGAASRHETHIEVRLRDGRVLHSRQERSSPLSEVDVREKFRRLASRALDTELVLELEEQVDRLAEADSLEPLVGVLTGIAPR